jgi:peptidoglycan/xylan/chitin deacetylase (PgdA/CDA1 family)
LFEYDIQGHDNIAWSSIYFSTDKAQNHFFYYDVSPNIIQNRSHVIVNREQFQIGKGMPKWEHVKYFRVAFESKPGTSLTIQPKKLATYSGGQGMVTLWFDDGWENAYTNAYRIVSEIDPTIRGVIPIVPSAIGTDRYLDKKQLSLLKSAGWEIVNHSYSHPYLTELSDDEIKDELQRSFSFISEYDPVGAYHFAVPFSAVDNRVLELLKDNTLSIRYLGETTDAIPFDRFSLGYKEVTNDTTFETVKGWIDEAIKNKQWLGLMFHRIEDPSDDRYSYGTQQFKKIIYYLSVMHNDVKTVTVTEAFKEVGLPITIKSQ